MRTLNGVGDTESMTRTMTWTITGDFDEYLAAVGPFLRREPVVDTLVTTIVDAIDVQGPHAFAGDPPLMGWWRNAAGDVAAALVQTPPFPVVLSRCPTEAISGLIDVLGQYADQVTQINLAAEHENVIRKGMEARTGLRFDVEERQRLYRLGRLVPPTPFPAGGAHVATAADRGLIVDWTAAFIDEALGRTKPNPEVLVDSRLPWGGVRTWKLDDGTPVSFAAMSREAAGMTRIGPVYTPPEHRGRGYAAAVTAAISRSALDAGIGEVLLFTNLDNPISNRVYQRIGYEPVTDRVILAR